MTVTASSKTASLDTPRARFLAGVRAILPIMTGVIPIALLLGVISVDTGLPVSMGPAMSLLTYAAASQFLILQLISDSAAWWVVIFSAWTLNLRFMLYSASLALHIKHLPTFWKAPLAYMLSDQVYGVSIIEFDQPKGQQHKRWFYFGAALTMWAIYQLATFAGAMLGTQLPESWSLDFAFPLTFMALLVLALKNRTMVLAAAVSGVVAVAAYPLPYSLNLPLAIGIGIAAGLLSERRFAQ
jgi:predicted branched-subunit amino acid permease